ncbi:methyl-accepting chemotaxis protein [Bacillus sp. VT-16-64]|nr:methyl-accepting chemotaxis protein [Bacillus sp. VT-16-64]
MKLFSWFYHLKTSVKLISVFVILAVFQIGINLLGLANMGEIEKNVDDMYKERLAPAEYLSEARFLFQELRVKWRDVTITDSSDELMKDVNGLREKIEQNIQLYGQSSLTKEQEALLTKFDQAYEEYKTAYDDSIYAIIDRKEDYNQFVNGDLADSQRALVDILDQMADMDADVALEQYKHSQEMYSFTKTVTIVSSVFTFLLSIGLGLFIARTISGPLNKVVGLVEKVASGDLTETVDIKTRDEIGVLSQSVNKMVSNLRTTIQHILKASENVSASAEQLSASTEEIAGTSTNQANAAQTMNELFKELSDAIQSVALNTERAAELSNETNKIAQEGGQVVHSSVEGMNVISSQMSRLEKDSNKIGEIVEVINDIADQTNLLALNAAIEAARAGEQGRGFAVVADEVRNLAERSSKATKEIADIIKNMQKNTVQSVQAVEDGVAFTEKTGEAFDHIIHMVNDTGQKVTEIAGASEEQAAQSAEVLRFIESISAATEEATASSEETASTATALADLAEELNQSAASFKIS